MEATDQDQVDPRSSLRRIYHNSANDLTSLERLTKSSPERPKSATNSRSDVNSNFPHHIGTILKRLSGSSDSDDNKDKISYRSILSSGCQQDMMSPVVISPITISRCICILISEFVNKYDKLPPETPNDLMDSREDRVALCEVFHRARARRLLVEVKEDDIDDDESAPPLPSALLEYFIKICVDSQMEYECSIITYIYLLRFLRLNRSFIRFTEDTYKGILLAVMLLSNKIWDDFAMSNSEYCSIFYGLTLHRVNELELSMLILMHNDLWVSRREYADAHFSVQELITKEEIERVRNLPSNQRVPVRTTKTILSREKSRSLLSEVSSAVSTLSEGLLRSSDEDGFAEFDAIHDIYGVALPPGPETDFADAKLIIPDSACSSAHTSGKSHDSEATSICTRQDPNQHSPFSILSEKWRVRGEPPRYGIEPNPVDIWQPLDLAGTRDITDVPTTAATSEKIECTCCCLWPFRKTSSQRYSAGRCIDNDDESTSTPTVQKKKSYSDVGTI